MKRLFVCMIALMLLCGCTAQSAETEAPTTPPTSQPVETQAVWVPYDGNSKHYTYFHTDERDRAWEEDVIFFGDSYLKEYPLLTPFPSRIEYGIEVEYIEDFYDEAMRLTFLEQINALIQQIPQLSDTEILYELQRMVAQLQDAHTSLNIEWKQIYPIGFQEFWEDGEAVFYVTVVPEKYDYALMCILTGINGIPLEEVIQQLSPYVSAENQYCLLHTLSGGSMYGVLSNRELLEITGIAENDRIIYNLQTDAGLTFDLKLNSADADTLADMDLIGHTHGGAYPEIYAEAGENQSYFYRWMKEDRMMYVRVNEFISMPEYSFFALGNDVIRELREAGGVEKLVVDLRRNPGGYRFYGYQEFINALSRMEFDSLYVLIDEATFSGGILMASQIKSQFPDTVLVGTPAGQPPNFFASMNDEDYVLPNSGVLCRMPTAFLCTMPDYEHDALMPDLIVYPTVRDYMLCIDTILEAVKAQ